jgi:hypothetical protein
MLTKHDRMKIDTVTIEDHWGSAFPQVEDDSGRHPVEWDTALSAVGTTGFEPATP